MSELFFTCPHCECVISILPQEINCGIFRHGHFYKMVNGNLILTNQINPHLSKEECERLIQNNSILGCGKPFKITKERKIEKCDYI